jgi:hypothetical protein
MYVLQIRHPIRDFGTWKGPSTAARQGKYCQLHKDRRAEMLGALQLSSATRG